MLWWAYRYWYQLNENFHIGLSLARIPKKLSWYHLESQTVRVCLVGYQDKKDLVEATTVEVKFSKACSKQMVTVCQPQPSHQYNQHTVQHCKEVAQETCYNVPNLEQKKINVEITLPEPVEKCETRYRKHWFWNRSETESFVQISDSSFSWVWRCDWQEMCKASKRRGNRARSNSLHTSSGQTQMWQGDRWK